MFNLDAREYEVIPILDSEFEVIHLDDNPTWPVKIGLGLPFEAKSTLIECLTKNADLFSISLHEMPDNDPMVACHHLNVDSEV